MNDVVSEKRREGKPLIKFKPLLLLYNLMMSTSALKFLLLLLILGSVYAQDDAAQALVDANPELLAVLNNYFGCSKWDSQTCLECSKGYFFNEKGICCEVSPQCRIFNQAQGICQACYQGYSLYNGTCKVITSQEQVNPGCLTWDGNHNCLACSARFYFNSQKVCTPVSDLCYTWISDGKCTACYGGYVLDSTGNCIINQTPFTATKDSLCKTWNNQSCIACAERAYFDSNGVCQAVSNNCNTWDAKTGNCMSCFGGYDLSESVCVFSASNNAKPADPGCNKWDWKNQVCISCSKNWVFNTNKVCVPVSDFCKTSNENGVCTSCYPGYDLTNGACLVSPSNNALPSDLGCASWSWAENGCKACSKNWVFNSNGVCTPVSTLCKASNDAGSCTSCYKGYDLKDGSCNWSDSNNAKPSDLGCNNWDWDSQVCLACSKNWVFNKNGVCVAVSDQCLTSNPDGVCTSCYKGYDLIKGNCVFSLTNDKKPTDGGCGKWNWDDQICLECSQGWNFDSKGVCKIANDQCKSWDSAGLCTACFKGYELRNGSCLFSSFNNAKPSDSGCAKWDWDNQVCLECSNGWTFNANKVCTLASDQCKKWDSAGLCTSCFKGYDLRNGSCVFSSFNNAKPSDAGCGNWDWDNQICLQCSNGWAFNTNKVCTPVNDQCKSWDSAGLCTSCFKGYDLTNGNCVFSSFNNAKPSDSGCAKWDWDNQVCLQCSNGWNFNANKVCTPVSDQCKSWDSAGLCTACFKGYDLRNGSCAFSSFNNAKPSDSGCAKWDWDNQLCIQCSQKWVMNQQGVCTPVSDQCLTWKIDGTCSSCYKGYDLKNGQCLFSQSNNAKPSDTGCGKWDWNNQVCLQCSNGWTFNSNKVCTPVSDQCKAWDSTGLCTACFKGYDLRNGSCVFSSFNNAKPSDSGCGKWDWDNQVCLECSKGWVFNANKVCTPVSDQCKTWDSAGLCTSCFSGYIISDNKCVPNNPLCRSSNEKGACLSCFTGYVLLNNACTPISSLASLYLYYSQCCPQKLATLLNQSKPKQ